MNTVNCAYGLLGERLSHSYSPLIHSKFGLTDYGLIETGRENLAGILRNEHYKGFNVTIPYKRDVIELCDLVSDEAREIGSVNTIVRSDNGLLCAYNTDIDGFTYLSLYSGIDFKNKKVLILGSGGTSLTAQVAAKKLGADRVTVISRNGEVTYDNLKGYNDADIIVNTTPIGMYPNNLESLFELDMFSNLIGVIDVVYNPRRTSLIMDAEKRGIPCIDGLPMLVYQAKRAEEIFLGKCIPNSEAVRVIKELRAESGNIVLIGMPGSGKTSVGELLAEKTGRRLINIDTEIEKAAGKTVSKIFAEDGESVFREYEREKTAEAGKLSGAVISTGGGVVKDTRNYAPLHQNGRIYYLRRELSQLQTEGRPLSKDMSALIQLQEERESLYSYFADAKIWNDATIEAAAEKILEEFHENIGDKRS